MWVQSQKGKHSAQAEWQQQLTAKQTIVIAKCVRQPLNPSQGISSVSKYVPTFLTFHFPPPFPRRWKIDVKRFPPAVRLNWIVNSAPKPFPFSCLLCVRVWHQCDFLYTYILYLFFFFVWLVSVENIYVEPFLWQLLFWPLLRYANIQLPVTTGQEKHPYFSHLAPQTKTSQLVITEPESMGNIYVHIAG